MANIAQTVNVLQADVLTDGDRLVLTPTYHVFEMNKGHQDAVQLSAHVIDSPVIEVNGEELPLLSMSASTKDGGALLSLTHLSVDEHLDVTVDLRGREHVCDAPGCSPATRWGVQRARCIRTRRAAVVCDDPRGWRPQHADASPLVRDRGARPGLIAASRRHLRRSVVRALSRACASGRGQRVHAVPYVQAPDPARPEGRRHGRLHPQKKDRSAAERSSSGLGWWSSRAGLAVMITIPLLGR